MTTTAYITGTTPYDLEIDIRNGKVTEHGVDKGLDDKVEEKFTFVGEYDLSESSMADAVLINGTLGAVYG